MSPLTEPTKLTLAKGQPVPVDLQGFGSVSLLLHGNGTNGSTTITDSSSNAVAITRAGTSPPVISTAQSKFGDASVLFSNSGVSSYLNLPASPLFSLPQDFTFECWAYVTSKGAAFGSTVIETTGDFTNGLVLRGDNPQTSWSWTVGGSSIGGGSLALNEWNHLAVSRASGTVRTFRDGVQQGTVTNSVAINPTAGIARIGESIATTVRGLNGYIDELRITKGVARYTSNFTPPTAPFPDF